MISWETVCTYPIGPYTVTDRLGNGGFLNPFTFLDPAIVGFK